MNHRDRPGSELEAPNPSRLWKAWPLALLAAASPVVPQVAFWVLLFATVSPSWNRDLTNRAGQIWACVVAFALFTCRELVSGAFNTARAKELAVHVGGGIAWLTGLAGWLGILVLYNTDLEIVRFEPGILDRGTLIATVSVACATWVVAGVLIHRLKRFGRWATAISVCWLLAAGLGAVGTVLHSVPWVALDPPREPDSAPGWSRDGRRISFERESEARSWSVDVRTGREAPLARGDPAFADLSPDRRHIMYEEEGAVFVADPDGRNRHRLAGIDVDWTKPSWSAENTIVLTRMNLERGGEDILIMSANGSDRRTVARIPDATSQSWSSRGELLAYTSEADSSHIRLVRTSNGTSAGRLTIACDGPAWSPDGRRIACMSTELEAHIYLVDLPSGNATRLETNVPACTSGWGELAWSPDGKRLAYACGRIWVLDADGRNARQLTGIE